MKKRVSKKELTQSHLKKLLHYNETTGIFTWKERPLNMFKPGKYQTRSCNIWNTRFASKEAGAKLTTQFGKTSYIVIGISLSKKRILHYAHRLAILYTDGHFPPKQVDHIDGNGLNNRRDNLRKVLSQENCKNRPMRSDNTSGCTGVYWDKACEKWKASILVNEKNIHGGYFIDIDDAIAKRKQMEIEHGYHKNHGRK